MTHDETLAVLLVLSNRVPAEHVIPDRAMALAWHADLQRFDSSTALNVAYAWSAAAFPSAGEFLSEVQDEARRTAALTLQRAAHVMHREKPSPEKMAEVHALVARAKKAIYDKAERAGLVYDPMAEDF